MDDEEEGAPKRANYDTERQVYPSLTKFAETLHDQLWKAYHNEAPQSLKYLARV